MPSRPTNPIVMAYNIREEYQKAVRGTVAASGCDEELLGKILQDLYATDEVYLSLNRPYKREAGTFADFCTKQKLHTSLREMFPDFQKRNLYIHQTKAIESILTRHNTIISTGTGSGKTESFLIPILDHCLKNRRSPGIKAIILYPINALAGDQLRRINEAVQNQAVTVGCFVGSTSKEERKSMIRTPPEILITNYVMLDRLITKPDTRSMFERSKDTLRYLVVDEIHYYRGTKGANLCVLLRRLRTLCAARNQLVQIGASATLRQGGGYYSDSDQQQIETYARSLFGREAAQNFRFITPMYDEVQRIGNEVDAFPAVDQPFSEFLEVEPDLETIKELADHLAGVQLPRPRPGHGSIYSPLYQFAQRNQFIQKMREELRKKAYTIDEVVELFSRVYDNQHHREARYPKEMVYAYLRLVNGLNLLYSLNPNSTLEPLLDYRLHLILSDLGGSLTRCLCCGRYHDGLRAHCISCNGLLFSVSKRRSDLCLARCNSVVLWPHLNSYASDTRNTFTVLVQPLLEHMPLSGTQDTCFAIEPNLDSDEDDESYILHPLQDQIGGVRILWPTDEDSLQVLELEKPRLYWQNVQKIVDATLIKPVTKIAQKLLGFIDNREKASGIRFRLRDEIAERATTGWAATQWAGAGALPLVTAYQRLEKQAQQYLHDESGAYGFLEQILREMPFWFARMLTRLDQYDTWKVRLTEDAAQDLQADELVLINEVFLPQSAIDRTAFHVSNTEKLKHFFLEKYRVVTEYGVGLVSAKEEGFDVVSLGERGMLYQQIIDRIGAARIVNLLTSLCNHGLLVSKQTRGGTVFYQLNPHYLALECSSRQADIAEAELPLALIECHTADNTSKERADIEQRFSAGEIHALICTPTLEMGVDIGDLTCVTMIGFPPSPANYAQRAGRAGRRSTLRSATIVVLSSFGNNRDAYYASDPRKMIDGTITPPQFTLVNVRLLAAHVYAHILAAKDLNLLYAIEQLQSRLERFIANDELDLRTELREGYGDLATYLRKDIKSLPGRIRDHEQGYRRGFFPDYGFRKDGLVLLDPHLPDPDREDTEVGILTRREPEEAVRKLAPGRIVFCGGRPVRVDQNQPIETYEQEVDPEDRVFRAYKHLLAEGRDELYVYARGDSGIRYQVTRRLRIKEQVEELQVQGHGYCRISLIRKGTLYLINEGTYSAAESGPRLEPAVPFHDQYGDYRFGTSLKRDGLLLSLSEQILPPDTRVNFLAVLLRSIPDYFNLDDGELRIASNVELFPSDAKASDGKKYIFIYGHDESGLVPFERIFEHLTELLRGHLQILESCSCDDDGCYHCLFSFNSQYLTGILSRQQAAAFLRAYLQISLLQPHIQQKGRVADQPDVILKVEWRGRCQVMAENRYAKTSRIHEAESNGQDQNTAIYTAINTALRAEAASGARSVHFVCNPPYIHDQLQGKTRVTKGQEAFFQVQLALRSWDSWTSERGK